MTNHNDTSEKSTVTRNELRDAIYRSIPMLSRNEAREIVDQTFQEIISALENGDDVKLSRFGHFKLRCKRERMGRNPKNGVEAVITPRRVATFQPSPFLVARVNGESPTDAIEKD